MTKARRTRVKICGITSSEIAAAAVDAGADALGFVFAAGSPRRLAPERARSIAAGVPPFVTCVGVHVAGNGASPDPDALGCGELAQLHGDVDPHFVAALDRPVIRALAFDADDIERWDGAAGVRALLVDGPGSGSGRGFDHAPLATMRDRIRLPLLLAGGLTADNVGDAIRAVRPYAVDVSSGVETAPGEKCPALIRAFCAAVQAADA